MNTTHQTTRQAHESGAGADLSKEFLSFRLDAEEYGIDILKVQEIRGFERPTRVADAPAGILGVLNLRGVIVPVLDLRIKFNLAHADYNDQTVTIVLNLDRRVIGVVVDSVSDVIELSPEAIKPAPEFSGAIGTQFITGLGTIEQGDHKRMLVLMDIENYLRSADVGMSLPTV